MNIDEIREGVERYKGERDIKYYMVAHLLGMVDALSGCAPEGGCPYATYGRQGEQCHTCNVGEMINEEGQKLAKRCWVDWADGEAREEA